MQTGKVTIILEMSLLIYLWIHVHLSLLKDSKLVARVWSMQESTRFLRHWCDFRIEEEGVRQVKVQEEAVDQLFMRYSSIWMHRHFIQIFLLGSVLVIDQSNEKINVLIF